MKNGVPLVDWARGAIPFIFIYQLLPVTVLVGGDENKIRWLGASIATLIFMLAGFIVFYYFYYDVWQPYWIVSTEGQTIRISEFEALGNANAIGPMRDRITMLVAQATDALLPVGLVAGVILATLAHRKSIVGAGVVMALTCMLAILITFTRSMLLSPLLIIFLFSLLIFFRKEARLKFSLISTALGVSGLAFIFATGMQDIWIGRISQLADIRAVETSQDVTVESKTFNRDETIRTAEKIDVDVITPPAVTATVPAKTNKNVPPSVSAADTTATKTGKAAKPSTHVIEPSVTSIKEARPSSMRNEKAVVKDIQVSEAPTKPDETTAAKAKDFNVSSRLDEYKIAWNMFLNRPAFGNGFGVKHKMNWETTDGVFLTKYVGYVHNWPFYMLMVGGLAGFALYSLVLFGPVVFRISSIKSEPMHWTLIRATILTMIVYAAFFAVFRLITFNLLIGAVWGIIFSQVLAVRQKAQTPGAEEPSALLQLQR